MSMNNAHHRALVGTSLEEPRDQILDSAPTFPDDLLIVGLSDADEAPFLAALDDLGSEPSTAHPGPS